MNNNTTTMTEIVTFEQAKALKEKEYPQYGTFFIYPIQDFWGYKKGQSTILIEESFDEELILPYIVAAPLILEVLDWLRTTKNIHIEVLLQEDPPYNQFYYRIMEIGKYFNLSHDDSYSNTPEECYSKALDNFLGLD